MLSNPAVGNGSQKFKRKLTNKRTENTQTWEPKTPTQELGKENSIATHRPGGENSGKGKHQEWEPKKPTQKAGRKNTNPGTGNTKTWEPETPREPKKPIWEKETPREGKTPIWELKTPNQRKETTCCRTKQYCCSLGPNDREAEESNLVGSDLAAQS